MLYLNLSWVGLGSDPIKQKIYSSENPTTRPRVFNVISDEKTMDQINNTKVYCDSALLLLVKTRF